MDSAAKEFERFKNNLSILEKRLSDDGIDLPAEIKIAATWLEYAQRPDISYNERQYLFQESLPRQFKNILTRKYDSSSTSFHVVTNFLDDAVGVFADRLCDFPEGMSQVLRDLMDPNQPFFKKYCAPKVEVSSMGGGVSSETQKFLDSMEVQSCIDFFQDRKWQMAMIESFDPYRTTMELNFLEDGKKEWVSVMENAYRMAPFGTKVGVPGAEDPVDPATAAVVGHSHAAGSESTAVDVTDSAWRFELTVGDLVDVRDKSGMWNQACILAMKKVLPSQALDVKIPSETAAVAGTPVYGPLAPPDVDIDAMYESVDDVLAAPAFAEPDAAAAAVAATAEVEAEMSAEPTPVATAELEEIPEESGGELAVAAVVAVAEPIPRTMLHVSYIGQPERFDEWVDLEDQDRLQQLNVFSGGRRGDNPLREEVLFLVNLRPSHQGEIDSYALHREGCFTEAQFIRYVNIFGSHRGFDSILRVLLKSDVALTAKLNVLIAVGGMHRVLTKSTLAAFCPQFLTHSSTVLNGMTNADIREIPIEFIEQTLAALEAMAYSHLGRNAASGKILEPLKLDIALRTLSSPFLNRRLGGLKLLTDLVKRADSALECPTGLRTSVSQSNGVESTSYRVVPITYFLTVAALAPQLGDHPALVGIFEGGSAHESLMTRASGVLCTIAKHNCLSERLLSAVWEAGFTDRKAEAMRCLAEVMAFLSPTSLRGILSSVAALDSAAITTNLVDIVASVAVRCRELLFEWGSAHLDCDPSGPDTQAVFEVYTNILQDMWGWIADESRASEAVVSRCIDKVESIFELGVAVSVAVRSETFPWAMHFHRMTELVRLAVEAIRRGSSIVQATRVLQLVANAWPVKLPAFQNHPAVAFLPFRVPFRSEIASHLIATHGILEALASAIIDIKGEVVAETVKTVESSPSWGSLEVRAGDVGTKFLPLTLQKLVNNTRVRGSQGGYLRQLEKCLDFFSVILKLGDDVALPRSILEGLWRAVVYRPLSTEEVDAVVNFFGRVVAKQPSPASSVAMDLVAVADSAFFDAIEPPAESSGSRGYSLCSRDTAEWVFEHLLCNTTLPEAEAFLDSSYFTSKAFQCVEKWFRWINVEAGHLADSKEKNAPFTLLVNPRLLKGLALFPAIIFTCGLDPVASSAVKFLTSLPQYFSPALKSSGALIDLRNYFLELCMRELRQVSDQTPSRINLSRVLLFVDGILEESAVNSELRVAAHGSVGRGTSVVFKVNAISNHIKPYCGDISMCLHDTVEDLFQAVAKQVHLPSGDIKIFRLGRELVEADFKKTIAFLRRNNENISENLQVAEKPHYKSKSPSVGDKKAPPSVVSPEGWELVNAPKTVETLDSMPAWVLANSADYFSLLFGLLRSSRGAACDKVWALLGRIPTSSQVMATWLDLECGNVSELLLDFDQSNASSLCDLLYRLQVVEVLLEPASSQADLDSHCRGSIELDTDKLQSWADRFVLKGGFNALCGAFEWIEFALKDFVGRTDTPAGVTPQLLQAASALSGKVIRAFLLRVASVKAEPATTAILRTVREAKKPKPSAAAVVSTSTSTGRTGDSPTSEGKTDEAAAAPMEVEEASLEEMLSSEWGWRLRSSDLLIDSLDLYPVDWLLLHRSALSMMGLLRRLSHHEYFQTKLYDSTHNARAASRHAAVLGALGDYLVMWGALCATKPELLHLLSSDVVVAAPFIDASLLLREVLLGQGEVPACSAYVEESKLSQAIGEWFVTALTTMVGWSGALQTVGEEGSLTSALVGTLFKTVLRLRPVFTHADHYVPSGGTVPASHKKLAPLFDLAAALLEHQSRTAARSDEPVAIPAEDRKRTCTVILEELRSAHSIVRSDPKVKFFYLEGTVRLLAALPCGEADVLTSVFSRSTQDFLLTGCLGIVSIQLSRVPIVCQDDPSRRYLCQILTDICTSNSIAAGRVLGLLKAAHTSVPAPTQWEFRPDRESRSATGFVGLRNLGSTCYMNSLLQVLYMNADIREYLLNNVTFVNQPEEVLRNDIAFQLRKVFFHLKHSDKKSYTPSDWTFAFKDEMGVNPINVMMQQDAQEFLQLLCERFEQSVHSYKDYGVSGLVDVMHQTFGGKLCNQMFKSSSGSDSSDTREQPETFVCISLEVKGCRNLEVSLSKFVEGEQIADYQWEEGQPKENITKRQCFSELNDTIVFHLKRFELNFDTFRREKVNDAFAFPTALNMLPYTKEGLAGKTGLHPAEHYEYELGGVVVHTGTSESGHYFSYLKDSSATVAPAGTGAASKWYEFNDSEVTVFSPSRIEAECFGGVTTSTDYNQHTQDFTTVEAVNPKSAYMLVYNRIKRQSAVHSAPVVVDAAVQAAAEAAVNPVLEMRKAVELENAQQALSLRVLTSNHLQLYKSLLDLTFQASLQAKRPFPADLMQEAFDFTTKCVSHTACHELFAELSANIKKYFDSYSITGWEQSLLPPPPASPNSSFSGSVAALTGALAVSSPVPGDVIDFSQPPSEADSAAVTPATAPGSDSPSAASTATASSSGSPESPRSASQSAKVEAIKQENFMPPPPPPPSIEQLPPAPPVNQLILCEVLKDVEAVVNNLFAPKEETRREFASLYLKLFELTAKQDGPEAFFSPREDLVNMKLGIITNAFGSTGGTLAAPMQVSSSPAMAGDDEDDLALAIRMSQEGSAAAAAVASSSSSSAGANGHTVCAPPGVAAVPAAAAAVAPSTTYDCLSVRFLWELTRDHRLQQIPENWRRSNGFVWLLLEIARFSWLQRDFMVRRQVVSSIVDIVLGDQSPLCGAVYQKGSRKRAPSSYCVVNVTKDDVLPLAAKNIPDWGLLLELLALLVRGCYSTANPVLISYHGPISEKASRRSVMDDWDLQAVTVKTLFSTLLRQARYSTQTKHLAAHLSYENKQFSDLICEVIVEELFLTAIDNTAHIFELLEAFLRMPDSFREHRATLLFAPGQANTVLEYLSSIKEDASKSRLCCVLVKSFLHLMNQEESVINACGRPHAKVVQWAPWMLKFCFRFLNKIENESQEAANLQINQSQLNQAILASHGSTQKYCQPTSSSTSVPSSSAGPSSDQPSPTAPPAPKGSFLLVYGESPDQREMTWLKRAEATSQALHAFLQRMGERPDQLIPEDTFFESAAASVKAPTVSSGTMMGPSAFDPTAAGLGNAMTDEEFAKLLASGNLDID